MSMNSMIHACNPKTLGSSKLLAAVGNYPTPGQWRSRRPSGELVRVKASTSDATRDVLHSSEGKNPLMRLLDVPRTIWRLTFQPTSDFGFGRRSLWEGGVGLFVVSGMALFALTLAWLRGFQLRSRFRTYQAVFEFSRACGICVGTPVRIRGVTVGNVVHVDSSLTCIEAVAEIEAMAEDMQPLLAEVRNSSMLKNVESIIRSLAEVSEELRKVHASILTPENAELIKKSIASLILILKNIEGVSSDIAGFTCDEAARRNMKTLIKSLSRLL